MTASLPKKKLMGVVAVLAFGLTALFGVLEFGALVPATFILGFFILLPLIGILGDALPVVESQADDRVEQAESTVTETTTGDADPVERLRERYANGELTDEEFERRLERLIETEDTNRWRRRRSDDREVEVE